MDFGKSFEVAKMSIAAIVGLNLLAIVLGMLPGIGSIGAMLGMVNFFVFNPIALAYAGYLAVKKAKLDMVGGAMAGLVAGVVGGIVNMVVSLVVVVAGLGAASAAVAAQNGTMSAGEVSSIVMMAVVVAGITSIVILGIGGLVCGAIGAVVAPMIGKK